MTLKPIPFNQVYLTGKEKDYAVQAIESRNLAGDGPFAKACEALMKKQLGCDTLLTASATAALEMAALLLDLKAGDEVIMPDFTFTSTATAFVLRGAVPVLIDVDPVSMNMDLNCLRQAISPRTKAIVVVHYAGVAVDMSTIMDIARQHGLWVVEDAAHGYQASTPNGRPLGTIGHLGVFSFHQTKNIVAGEGGALLINDERFLARAEVLREKGTNRRNFLRGQVDKYTWVDIGSSFLPCELAAAVLLAQLEEATTITAMRCQAYRHYRRYLRTDLPLSQCPDHLDQGANAHIFFVKTADLETRTKLMSFLSARGIQTTFHYQSLAASPAGKTFCRAVGDLPHSHHASNTLLRLPLYPELQEDEAKRVATTIHDFYTS